MEYRWYIGKELGGNLLTLIAGSWTELDATVKYTFGANTVTHANTAPNTVNCIQTNADIFTVGEYYNISYGYVTAAGASSVKPYIGNYTLKAWEGLKTSKTISFDAYCRAGTKMRFTGIEAFTINALSVKKYSWMDVLTGDDCPYVEEGLKIETKRSTRNVSVFVDFIEKVVFYKASYDRLMGLIRSGIDAVPVKIEMRATELDDWEQAFEGVVYESDLMYDAKRTIATSDIEDNAAGSLLLKNIEKEYEISTSDAREFSASLANKYNVGITVGVDCHKPDDGTYLHPYGALETIQVKTLLENIIFESTGMVVGLNSLFLTDRSEWHPGASNTENIGLTTRKLVIHPFYSATDRIGIKSSIDQLLKEYFKLFAVYGYINDSAQRELVVEDKAVLEVDSGIVLTGVNDIIVEGRKGNAGIDIGFNKRSTKDDSGIRTFINKFTNSEIIIDLVTDFYAGNCNEQRPVLSAVLDILDNYHWSLFSAGYGATTKQNDSLYLLEYEEDGGGGYQSMQGVDFVYNPSFEISDWVSRMVSVLSDLDTFISTADTNFYVYLISDELSVTGTDSFNYNCSFKYPLELSDFKIFKSNPFAYLTIQSDHIHPYNNVAINDLFVIDELKYNVDKKMAEFKGRMT